MNAESLRATIERLLKDEGQFAIQQRLTELQTALSQLASQPGQPQYQIQVSSALTQLRTTAEQIALRYDPSALRRIAEIGANRFFGLEMSTEVDAAVAENPMTPAVAQQRVSKLLSDRSSFLEELRVTAKGLGVLGVSIEALDPGGAEIGFQIPRELFSNELAGLISELRVLRRVIRAFAEVATGSIEPIEVRQLSTSDPTFFFGLSLATVTALGGAVQWALARWKEVEEIRKVRAETQKLTSFTPEEIGIFFDNKITATIDAAVSAKADQIVPITDGETGRRHEQRTDVEWALSSLLARIERGMTVEIRFLPPESSNESAAADASRLADIVPTLSFPPRDPDPILSLPKLSDREAA